jgi:hypothetical protein
MSFTITKQFEQLPSWLMLCGLAEQNHVLVSGDERVGSFSGRSLEGNYTFGEGDLHGRFVVHGVAGEFSFETGKAAVTIVKRPFWLPEALLKHKIAAGLDTLCTASKH